jgi:outer membrane receptor protein involved in Fe transport
MSITAVSADTLGKLGAQTIADVARQAPGLSVVSSEPGQNTLILRGISSAGGNSPTVGFYIDDIPLPSLQWGFAGGALDPAMLDLDHVEILRGPQGTLYGASSMGGTVKYVTRQPNLTSFEASAEAIGSVTESGGPNNEEHLLFNQVLADGEVAARGVAFYRHESGYLDRYPTASNDILAIASGPVQKRVNTEDTYGGHLSVRMQPSDVVTVTPSMSYQRIRLGAPFTFDSPPGTFNNPIQSRLTPEPTVDQIVLPSLLVQATLGPFDLTSSSSYFDRTLDLTEDVSKFVFFVFSPSPQSSVYPVPFPVALQARQFAQEIRAAAHLGRVHWLIGLYYSHDSDFANFSLPIPAGYNALFGNPFGQQPFYFSSRHTRINDSAAFSEINFDLTDRLRATVGARVFDVSQANHNLAEGVFEGGTDLVERQSKDTGTTPKLGLDFHLTPTNLLYVSATKGFRPGGGLGTIPATLCNGDLRALGLSSPPTSYSADTLWSYEVGEKATLADQHVSVDVDAYYISWSKVQQQISLPTCGATFTGNFGTAVSKGTELEFQFDPSQDWHASVGGAFNQAQLTSTVPGAQGRAGNVLENAPKWMGTASGEYHLRISPSKSMYGLLNVNTTSHEYNNFDPASNYYTSAGYTLANARLGLKASHWQAAVFCDNLFNKHAETALPISNAADLPIQRRISLYRFRTIGLDFRWDY